MKPTENLDSKLQQIADTEQALVLSFIAPDTIVRMNPASFDYATISTQDLYNVEKVISQLKDESRLPDKLHLVIQSPGGSLDVSTKIARYLQGAFKDIEVYVPFQAASGGTMLCLTGNKLILSDCSNLTPIDPQLKYKGQWISATSYEQAIKDFEDKFPKQRPEEIPSPYQQMCNSFDPVILQEMKKIVIDTIVVAAELLKVSRGGESNSTSISVDDIYKIAFALGKTEFPHSHIFTREDLNNIGLVICEDSDKIKTLKIYKEWVSSKLNNESTSHIVEYYCPTKIKGLAKGENVRAGQQKSEPARAREPKK